MVAAGKQSTHRPVDHLGQRGLVNRHHRGPTGQGLERNQALTFVVGGVNDQVGRTEVEGQLLKTHAGLNMDGVSNTQSLGLSHEGFAHVTPPDDDQTSSRVLFEDKRHRPEEGAMAFARHQTAHGQQERRPRVRSAAQRCLIGGIVGFAKRLVRQLFLLVVVVHWTEHLVVNAVQHRLAVPILGRPVPLLEFTTC